MLYPRLLLQGGVGEDDLSRALNAIQAKLRGEDGEEKTEEELIKVLLGDVEGGDKVKDLAGLKAFMGKLLQSHKEFGNMEAGHTRATQKLAALEKRLAGLGVDNVDAFLSGKIGKPTSRKGRLKALLETHQIKKHPFWDDFIEAITEGEGDVEEVRRAALAAWLFSTMLGKSVWQHQLRTNKKYDGVDDEVMGKMMERLGSTPAALMKFMQEGKNPLEQIYTEVFAELHPEILEGKIKEAGMEKPGEGSGFVERPGAGSAPVKPGESGKGRNLDQIAKDIKEASGGQVIMPPTSGN